MIIVLIVLFVIVFVGGVLVALKNGKKITDTASAVKTAADDITNAVK
jgi:flagellar basal body-associated protein FliL